MRQQGTQEILDNISTSFRAVGGVGGSAVLGGAGAASGSSNSSARPAAAVPEPTVETWSYQNSYSRSDGWHSQIREGLVEAQTAAFVSGLAAAICDVHEVVL